MNAGNGDPGVGGNSGIAQRIKHFFRIATSRKIRRIAYVVGVLGLTAYAAHIYQQYQHLEKEFIRPDEYLPTRIYSDITRIAPPMQRGYVSERLERLGYDAVNHDYEMIFRLHEADYPAYLLPPGDPSGRLRGKPVRLNFDGPEKDAVLVSIEADGEELASFHLEPELVATLSRGGGGGRHIRDLVRFHNIPSYVWQAIIAVEDQHFRKHRGFDPKGLARAIWVNLKSLSFKQGGSTLTQQLVKNLMARRSKNLFKKLNELFLSLILEMRFEKNQILERYLNEVYLGQIGYLEVHGVAEGAKYFFDKELDELNLGEIALMAGLIRGPGYYSPYRHFDRAVARQKTVLRAMVDTGFIAEEEMELALRQPIRLSPPPTARNKAPYFTDFVKAELVRIAKDRLTEQEITDSGFRIYTTLDPVVNNHAQNAVERGIERLEKRIGDRESPGRLEGALAAVDHSTGFIRALIGGKSYSESTFNRILNMKRQVGSTFKPIVYMTAFRRGYDHSEIPYGPGYPIEDAPWKLVYDAGRQQWAPSNYSREHRGWITLRTALANSINIPTAKLGVRVGISNIIDTARALGVTSELPAVPSLTLGVPELSPVELLKVYATFANRGVRDELTVIRAITHEDGSGYARFVYHPRERAAPATVDLVNDLLREVFFSGTARGALAMGFERPAAGKTGTTSDHRDAWFAGFTPHLTAVTWVGFDRWNPVTGEDESAEEAPALPIRLTGAGAALPVWVDFMKNALENTPPSPFPLSEHLTDVRIDSHTGLLAESDCPEDQVVLEKYPVDRVPEDSSCAPDWPTSVGETVLE